MYYQCWLEVTRQQQYRDKWLTDETYFRAIKAQFPPLESLGFDRGKMNKAISTHGGTTLDDFPESNQTGRLRHQAGGYNPFGNPLRNVHGYYVTTPGGKVECPPPWWEKFLAVLKCGSCLPFGKVEEDDDKTRVPEMEEHPVSKSHNKWMTFKSAVHSMFRCLNRNILARLNGKCAKRRQNIQYEWKLMVCHQP